MPNIYVDILNPIIQMTYGVTSTIIDLYLRPLKVTLSEW